MRNIFLLNILVSALFIQGFAQPYVRQDDKFWSKRVVNRISLVEKVNRPLVYHESGYYSDNSRYEEIEGVVASLINGVKQGKYVAYDPENWQKTLNSADLEKRMRAFQEAIAPVEEEWEEGSENLESLYEEEWEVEKGEDWANPFNNNPASNTATLQEEELDLAAYEEVIHMVEDWVFDKNRSEMVQVIDYFEVIWADPSGTLPEKVLARFKWKDVKDQLDKTQWKTRFNDAETRSVREIFELRIFNSILIDVGGEPVRSLMEAERKDGRRW